MSRFFFACLANFLNLLFVMSLLPDSLFVSKGLTAKAAVLRAGCFLPYPVCTCQTASQDARPFWSL